MSSRIIIRLDRTGPRLSVDAPWHSIQSNIIQVTIISDEPIADNTIYVIDSHNNRHDYIFTLVAPNKLIGYIDFIMYPTGQSILHIDAVDNVMNISTMQKPIYIGNMPGSVLCNVCSIPYYTDVSSANEYLALLDSIEWTVRRGETVECAIYDSTQTLYGDYCHGNDPVEVDNPQIIITDDDKNVLDTFDIPAGNRTGVGKYFYDLHIRYKLPCIYYAFVGKFGSIQVTGRHKLVISYTNKE